MRIVVADDDAVVRMILESALKSAGHDVICVEDGAAALKAVRDDGARVLITDWDMPQMTGVELCRTLRTEGTGGYV